MTTANAVAQLRQALGMSQAKFAEELGVTVTSVSRYENGREPNANILNRLVELSRLEGLDYLQEVFGVLRRRHIRQMAAKLPTVGTARRVALSDLQRWAQDWMLQAVAGAINGQPNFKMLKEAFGALKRNQKDMLTYLNPPDSQPEPRTLSKR